MCPCPEMSGPVIDAIDAARKMYLYEVSILFGRYLYLYQKYLNYRKSIKIFTYNIIQIFYNTEFIVSVYYNNGIDIKILINHKNHCITILPS